MTAQSLFYLLVFLGYLSFAMQSPSGSWSAELAELAARKVEEATPRGSGAARSAQRAAQGCQRRCRGSDPFRALGAVTVLAFQGEEEKEERGRFPDA